MTDLIVDDAPLSAGPHTGRSRGRGSTTSGGDRVDTTRSGGDETNTLANYGPAILALRWATLAVSIMLASRELLAADPIVLVTIVVVSANAVFRTIRPIGYSGSLPNKAALGAELALPVIAVIATGFWESALVVLMINAVVIAGFAVGFSFAVLVGVMATLAVTAAGARSPSWDVEQAAQAAQWTTVLLSGGLIAGYTRRISGEASRRHSMALDRVARLADANALLADLHRVAQTLPASLDLGDVLDSTIARLRGLVDHDGAIVLTREEADGSWKVAIQRGMGMSGELGEDQMPEAVRQAIRQHRLVRLPSDPAPGTAFGRSSKAGVYVPLLARGRVIGLLGIESRTVDHFAERDVQILRGFVEPVALSIDNARWFGRIRTIAADEERTRIARDLHDRIGQSLAYLAVEVDRMIRRDDAAEPNGENLRRHRDDIRGVVGEVRETLSDLRSDVADDRDFADTVNEFVNRLSERSGLAVSTDLDADRRLPILQEREMWRIAKEALINVERHADAKNVSLRWRCDRNGTLLEITDDGKGLPARSADGRLGRSDSYGILGMRERADSVGATLELQSKPREGTTVRCFLPQT
ncbi:MAG: histidine kinase [Acidimicrobiales bacterium]